MKYSTSITVVPLLLLFCICSGVGAAADFKTIPFDAKEHLIVYNTEGQGDDKEIALLQMSKALDEHKSSNVGAVGGAQKMSDAVDAAVVDWSSFHQYDRHGNAYHHHTRLDEEILYAQRRDEHMNTRFKGNNIYEGFALSDAFLSSYYSNKARCVATEHDTGDQLLVYDYEGQESCMGSLEDICSIMNEDNLAFLNDLGLKFKTLAEICSGSTMETDISVACPVTPEAVPSVPRRNVITLGKVSTSATEKASSTSTFLQATGTDQVSGASLTGAYIQRRVTVPRPALLVQQPALYYTSTNPLYVVDPHPALLVTASPVMGLQENLLVVEKNLDVAQHATFKRDVQQKRESSLCGEVQIVEAEMIQSTATHGVKQVLHSASRGMSAERRPVDSLDVVVGHSLSTTL